MKIENPIQSLIEVDRPDPIRGLEEIKSLIHLNDNMVRRVTAVLARSRKNHFNRAA